MGISSDIANGHCSPMFGPCSVSIVRLCARIRASVWVSHVVNLPPMCLVNYATFPTIPFNRLFTDDSFIKTIKILQSGL